MLYSLSEAVAAAAAKTDRQQILMDEHVGPIDGLNSSLGLRHPKAFWKNNGRERGK